MDRASFRNAGLGLLGVALSALPACIYQMPEPYVMPNNPPPLFVPTYTPRYYHYYDDDYRRRERHPNRGDRDYRRPRHNWYKDQQP